MSGIIQGFIDLLVLYEDWSIPSISSTNAGAIFAIYRHLSECQPRPPAGSPCLGPRATVDPRGFDLHLGRFRSVSPRVTFFGKKTSSGDSVKRKTEQGGLDACFLLADSTHTRFCWDQQILGIKGANKRQTYADIVFRKFWLEGLTFLILEAFAGANHVQDASHAR